MSEKDKQAERNKNARVCKFGSKRNVLQMRNNKGFIHLFCQFLKSFMCRQEDLEVIVESEWADGSGVGDIYITDWKKNIEILDSETEAECRNKIESYPVESEIYTVHQVLKEFYKKYPDEYRKLVRRLGKILVEEAL